MKIQKTILASMVILALQPFFAIAQTSQDTSASTKSMSGEQTDDKNPKSDAKAEAVNPLLKQKDLYEALENQDDNRIFRHKPVYFAYSNPLTKVQLSFRSLILEDTPLFFGYTQVIFWELGADSKPFRDATYNPEFFYRYSFNRDIFKFLDVGIWEHNSNGKAGEVSRSFDQAYLKASYAFETRRWVVAFTTKLSYIYNNDDTNRDILTYIGPLDLGIKFTRVYSGAIDKSEFTLNIHPGGKYGTDVAKGGYELTYSFRFGGLKVVPAFYVQYFTGYGETLLTYNQRQDQYRFGLLF